MSEMLGASPACNGVGGACAKNAEDAVVFCISLEAFVELLGL